MSSHVQEPALRCPILKFDPRTGRVTAKCARCKASVRVPLRYVG